MRAALPLTLAVLTSGALSIVAADCASAIIAQAPPDVVIACGANAPATLAVTAAQCTPLQSAITNASVDANETVIELMPGTYCPITIGFGLQNLTIVGAGLAGFASSYNLNGAPESTLSTFQWSASCPGAKPAAQITMPDSYVTIGGINGAVAVKLENLAVVGTPTGPSTGIAVAQGGDIDLRDVLVEDEPGVGFDYKTTASDHYLIENSAFLDNGTGVRSEFVQASQGSGTPGIGAIDESTIDGNKTGLDPLLGPVQLVNDTISNNVGPTSSGVGIDLSTGNSDVDLYNTIVGQNDTDCLGQGPPVGIFGEWESGGSTHNANNLVGSTCYASSQDGDDIQLANTLAAPTNPGGLTPSVSPPAQATGTAVQAHCGSTGTDQEEAAYTSGACDIGAVDSTGDAAVSAQTTPTSMAFGSVAYGVTSTDFDRLSNAGGGLLGVTSVAVSGAAFSLYSDSCTFMSLFDDPQAPACVVLVSYSPATTNASDTGTLTYQTLTGPVTVALTGSSGSTAAAPPNPPKALHADPRDGYVQLDWQAATQDFTKASITGYLVHYSDNGGTTWQVGPSFGPNDNSGQVNGLTNGTPYLFEIETTSSVGDSAVDKTTAAVTPKPTVNDPPVVPTNVIGTPGNGLVAISWSAPVNNGEAFPSGYQTEYSSDGGTTWAPGPTVTGTSTTVTGLSNGTAYVFAVRATSTAGPSPYSTQSAPVTPSATIPAPDPSQLATMKSAAVVYGATHKLTTTLTDATTGAKIASVPVVLEGRVGTSGSFVAVGSPTTNAAGAVTVVVKPARKVQYRWSFAGDVAHNAVVGAPITITVAQSVHAALSAKSVKHGKPVKVYGTVLPATTGKAVVLQQLVHGKWRSLKITTKLRNQTMPNHKKAVGFLLSLTEKHKGTVLLRVSSAATAANAVGNSARLTLHVK